MERSLVLIKPDAVQRGLIGEITARLEKTGLKIVAAKMVKAQEDQLWSHYNKDDAWFEEKGTKTIESKKERGDKVEKEAIEYGKDIIRVVIDSMMLTPIIAIVFEGAGAVSIVKKLVGETEPKGSPAGTIRGDLAMDSYALSDEVGRGMKNLIHCSDADEAAEREVKIWFDEKEIFDYTRPVDSIMY